MENEQEEEQEKIQKFLADHIQNSDLEDEFQEYLMQKEDESHIELNVHSFQFMQEMIKEFLEMKGISLNAQPAQNENPPTAQQITPVIAEEIMKPNNEQPQSPINPTNVVEYSLPQAENGNNKEFQQRGFSLPFESNLEPIPLTDDIIHFPPQKSTSKAQEDCQNELIIQPASENASKVMNSEEQLKLIENMYKQEQIKLEIQGRGEYITCKKVELNKIGKFMQQNPNKKPKVSIQSYRLFDEGGFLKQKYALFTVNVSHLKWTCYRRFSDFAMLRAIFENQFPSYFIPPLPKKTLQRKLEPEYLQKRMKILEQFMEGILENELLKNSQQLEDFLYIQEESRYRKQVMIIKEGPVELSQIYSMDGKINCSSSQEYQNYGQAFRNYTGSLTDLYGQAKSLTKEVITNLEATQKSLKSLSTVFDNLSKLSLTFNTQNKIGINVYLQKLYDENSKFLLEYSEVLSGQNQLFKDHIYTKIRYEKKVCPVFEEMAIKRNKLNEVFQEANAKLNLKKKKLFEKKDMKSWELESNLQIEPSLLLKDEQKAMKYMLPRESAIVRQMNQKINFFSSNLFFETRKYLKIRETKISEDFIEFTNKNGDLLKRLKDYHDIHLNLLNQIATESKENLFRQYEEDKIFIQNSQNQNFEQGQQMNEIKIE